jgi:hypothetical protein
MATTLLHGLEIQVEGLGVSDDPIGRTAVLVIDRCPSQPWIARVSWHFAANNGMDRIPIFDMKEVQPLTENLGFVVGLDPPISRFWDGEGARLSCRRARVGLGCAAELVGSQPTARNNSAIRAFISPNSLSPSASCTRVCNSFSRARRLPRISDCINVIL